MPLQIERQSVSTIVPAFHLVLCVYLYGVRDDARGSKSIRSQCEFLKPALTAAAALRDEIAVCSFDHISDGQSALL
jgi:hypothetical protein